MDSGNEPPPAPPKLDQSSPQHQSQESSQDIITLDQPCKISNVRFEGIRRTSSRLLGKIVADIFPAKTLNDLLERIVETRIKLESLNALKSTQVNLEKMEDDSYEVIFSCEEKTRFLFNAQTAVDNHSTHINLQLTSPNLNGIGDSIHLNSRFNKRIYSGECRYSIPFSPWKNLWAPRYSILYNQFQWGALPSGLDQEDRSIVNQIEFFSLPQLHHNISFENIWRYLKSSSPKTPLEVREQAGHSVKSSIKHTLTWDTRLGGNFPYEGILTKISNEFTLNLVNGCAKFTRHELNLKYHTLILPRYDVSFEASLLAGTLLRQENTKINICDKFFAGGPLTLRGFQLQGLEPTIRGHPIGDLSFLSAGAHIYSILPYTKLDSTINQFIRPHIFFNSGTLGDLTEGWRITGRDDLKRQAIRFSDSLRHSCGCGLVMYFMSVRLELNFCWPLVFMKDDLKQAGFQWGFGLQYT